MVMSAFEVSFIATTVLVAGSAMPITIRKGTTVHAISTAVDFIVSGEQVAHKKPAPDLYQLALLKLGVGPLECVALEDSNMGLLAARSAGIPTLITINEDTRHHAFDDASLVVESLGEPETCF